MAQNQQRFSNRDRVYLNSPGFEPFIVAGIVFVVVFTAIFIFSIRVSLAWLAWPGMGVAAIVCYGVLRWGQRREYARKLAEVEADPVADEVTRR
jgi:multidrug transporter EmrE-like cation transporter